MSELIDSGVRVNFDSGAVRELSEDKGRMDLIPLSFLVDLFLYCDSSDEIILDETLIIKHINDFLSNKEPKLLLAAFQHFSLLAYDNIYEAILDLSHNLQQGAAKYSDWNYARGLPMKTFIDSSLRHLMKFLAGWEDEPHNRAVLFNLMAAYWTYVNKPECRDFVSEYDFIEKI